MHIHRDNRSCEVNGNLRYRLNFKACRSMLRSRMPRTSSSLLRGEFAGRHKREAFRQDVILCSREYFDVCHILFGWLSWTWECSAWAQPHLKDLYNDCELGLAPPTNLHLSTQPPSASKVVTHYFHPSHLSPPFLRTVRDFNGFISQDIP